MTQQRADHGKRDGKRRTAGGRGGDRRRMERREKDAHDPVPSQDTFLTVPSTPQRILFKGIDCEVNGRKDLAMYLYLQGAVGMSGGCESNADRMLREAGKDQFPTIRGRVAKSCPPDAVLVFDYLCATIDNGYDTSALLSAAESGNTVAIHCLIRLDRVDGDSPLIDSLAAKVGEDEGRVVDGLKLVARRRDSAKAEAHLKEIDDRRRLRQSIRQVFAKARKGDAESLSRLEELSDTFPEAGFLRGFLDAEDRESYLRDGMEENRATVISMANELGMQGTPFGKYLSAMKLQADGGEWIQPMINAAAAGSEDALEALRPLQNRRDVRKALASAYLSKGDTAGLVRCYDGEDATYLDRYCSGSASKAIALGELMNESRRMDWLKRCFENGMVECRDAIVSMAESGCRSKQMVYTLHDVGADMEAARLYMDMYGDRSLPSVKWLAKVCSDDSVKDYVRSRFEEIGDPKMFEYIFVDDGYVKGGKGHSPRGGQRTGSRGKGRDGPRGHRR